MCHLGRGGGERRRRRRIGEERKLEGPSVISVKFLISSVAPLGRKIRAPGGRGKGWGNLGVLKFLQVKG